MILAELYIFGDRFVEKIQDDDPFSQIANARPQLCSHVMI
jgi:hypothetical protein